jgi:hypothetical protein
MGNGEWGIGHWALLGYEIFLTAEGAEGAEREKREFAEIFPVIVIANPLF